MRSTRLVAAFRSHPGVTALVTVVVLALVVLTVLSLRGPGRTAAQELAEDYLDAKVARECGHYAYYSEELARSEHVDVKDCQADQQIAEGEYFEYSVEDVRVDGVRAEVDVEDDSDAPRGPFTLVLVVEDGAWRIGEIIEEDEEG
jgi:hypothetical protein